MKTSLVTNFTFFFISVTTTKKAIQKSTNYKIQKKSLLCCAGNTNYPMKIILLALYGLSVAIFARKNQQRISTAILYEFQCVTS
ncbi:MAG: hypothetical protein U0T32_13970 [Chitinophagales bacterium]|jgi:hypothetical protein